MNKLWIVAVLLAVVAVVPIFYIAYNTVQQQQRPAVSTQDVDPAVKDVTTIEFSIPSRLMEEGAEFAVKTFKVHDGYAYTLVLDNGQTIDAKLPVITKPEATSVLIGEIVGKSPVPPKVTLLRKVGDKWIVEIALGVAGPDPKIPKYVKLREVLQAKNLLL